MEAKVARADRVERAASAVKVDRAATSASGRWAGAETEAAAERAVSAVRAAVAPEGRASLSIGPERGYLP